MKKSKKFLSNLMNLLKSEKGEGALMYILLAAGLITILAFVLIPGLRTFASSLISSLTTWFANIDDNIFGTS